MSWKVRPLAPATWPDLVELFERRGPRGGHRNTPAYGCWCMYWRDRTLEHGEPKKRALEKLVRSGEPTGLLAYDEGSPVGWVSIAPREQYAALLASPQYRPRDGDQGVWSIVCFAVEKYAQRQGIAGALLTAAVDHARAGGASSIEAYAHTANPADYMGSLDLYLAHGFRPLRDAGKRTIARRVP